MLNPGTKLGPYEILSPLGAGGMGEVYRARDTKLNREVALKVLPAAMANDAERMARFEREAQVLASLNHPNIASIYGLEESGGVRALVMELVEGPTLAERISVGAGLVPALGPTGGKAARPQTGMETARGRPQGAPLQMDEALPIAKQIAEALEFAHERGIIHRDLKPANVKVASEGAVKVLDFGLAKALATEASGVNLANSPTISIAATQAGVIIGTAAYMSPEQAKGKTLDRRTDIWAFGCVLYEMLTGKQAFEGETVSDVLAAVIMRDPDWNELPESAPPSIRRLLRRCLEKDSKRRLRDIGEARITIEERLTGGTGVSPVTDDGQDAHAAAVCGQDAHATWRRVLPWTLAVISCAAFLITLIILWRATSDQRVLRVALLPPPDRHFAMMVGQGSPALSPDGTRVAFVAAGTDGKSSLWVRRLDQVEATQLPGTDGGYFPFWSPDGSHIAFFAKGHLWKAGSAGEPPVSLADVRQARGGSWNTDGTILFTADITQAVLRVPANGGTPIPAVRSQPGFLSQRWPFFLPDGNHFIYLDSVAGVPDPGNEVHYASLDGREDKALLKCELAARYAQGRLLFVRDGVLMAQQFDPSRGTLRGEAMPVATGVGVDAVTANSLFSTSGNGALVYAPANGGGGEKLIWFDRGGKKLGTADEGSVLFGFRLSPDASQAAVTVLGSERVIWLFDLRRGSRSRFSFVGNGPGSIAQDPVWTPDGKTIFFVSRPSATQAQYAIYRKPADGSAPEQLVWKTGANFLRASDITPDGRELVVEEGLQSGDKFEILPLAEGAQPTPFLSGGQYNGAFSSALSPDGHWFAYGSTESGPMQVYITSFPRPGAKYQVSVDGGTQPVWARDGKTLFFLDPGGKLMAANLNTKSDAIRADTPVPLFATNMRGSLTARGYDVTRDGRFLVDSAGEEQNVQVTLVVNWTAELKK